MAEIVRILTQDEIDALPTLCKQRSFFVLPDGRFAAPVDQPQLGEPPAAECCGAPREQVDGDDAYATRFNTSTLIACALRTSTCGCG